LLKKIISKQNIKFMDKKIIRLVIKCYLDEKKY